MNSSKAKNILEVINQIIDDENSYSFMRKSGLDYYDLKIWTQENAYLLSSFKTEKLSRFIDFVNKDSPDFSGYKEKDFSSSKEKENFNLNNLGK
ncbi:MAG: hypothetical protein IPK10_08055 [Bacteroidetes bacterium]|nr:hypothetical protein [Bacteroidota bacterium]